MSAARKRALASVLDAGWRLVREVGRRFHANDGDTLAAAMAYYAALSFFPLVLVLISVLGYVLRLSASARHAQEELLQMLAKNVAPVMADSVRNVLSDVEGSAGLGGPLGLAMVLLGAMGVFARLDAALYRLWRRVVPVHYGVLKTILQILLYRLRAFLLLLVLGILVVLSFFVEVILAVVRTWATDWPGGATGWRLVQLLSGLGMHWLVFTLLYKALPPARVRWFHALVCGLAVALVWEVGRQAVAALVVRSSYTAYGVVGSFIVMMLWVYCASCLVLIGAQTVQVLGHPEE